MLIELPTEKIDDLARVYEDETSVQSKEVKRYGGRPGLRVVDSLEEAIGIMADQDAIKPLLFVLSCETYCSIMQRQDALHYLSRYPETLCGVPFVINKNIR